MSCTNAEVQYLLKTDVASGTIDSMITISDGQLTAMLDGASMTAANKKYVVMRLVAIDLANRYPKSMNMPGLAITYGERIAQWEREINRELNRVRGYITRA